VITHSTPAPRTSSASSSHRCHRSLKDALVIAQKPTSGPDGNGERVPTWQVCEYGVGAHVQPPDRLEQARPF